MGYRSGQVLVLVLLIVVVSLAIGLSVASRNITNLKTATQSERSQRAFSAAEGGVEDILSQLSTISSDPQVSTPTGKDFTVPVGDTNAIVNVKAHNTYESVIELGTVGQVDLKDYSGDIRLEWSKSGESADPATLEVIEYYQPSAGTFSQKREAWQGLSGRPGESGSFSTPSSACSGSYRACAVFNIDVSAPGTAKYLRIRPFWARASVSVSGIGGAIPLQSFDLESTARTAEGITRKVVVKRNALPALPAAFDYVLFSSGSITK